MNLRIAFVSCLLFLFASQLYGQSVEYYTETLTDQLDREGVRYSTISTGIKVNFNMDDDRTQMVFIFSKPYSFKGTAVREIKSVASGVNDKYDFGESLLVKLMEETYSNKVGAWQLNTSKERKYLEFALRIPVRTNDEDLVSYLRYVAKEADKLELEITAEDEF